MLLRWLSIKDFTVIDQLAVETCKANRLSVSFCPRVPHGYHFNGMAVDGKALQTPWLVRFVQQPFALLQRSNSMCLKSHECANLRILQKRVGEVSSENGLALGRKDESSSCLNDSFHLTGPLV